MQAVCLARVRLIRRMAHKVSRMWARPQYDVSKGTAEQLKRAELRLSAPVVRESKSRTMSRTFMGLASRFTSQQYAGVSLGPTCSDCHTEVEGAGQTCRLTRQISLFHKVARKDVPTPFFFSFFFFFCAFLGYISGVHHFWVRFVRI